MFLWASIGTLKNITFLNSRHKVELEIEMHHWLLETGNENRRNKIIYIFSVYPKDSKAD